MPGAGAAPRCGPEIAEGLGWLAAHRVLRATAAMVAVVNLLAAGGGAIAVLFAQDRLGLDAVGFGLLAPFVAAGVVIPVAALLCLPAVNNRTVAAARAAAGLEPGP